MVTIPDDASSLEVSKPGMAIDEQLLQSSFYANLYLNPSLVIHDVAPSLHLSSGFGPMTSESDKTVRLDFINNSKNCILWTWTLDIACWKHLMLIICSNSGNLLYTLS